METSEEGSRSHEGPPSHGGRALSTKEEKAATRPELSGSAVSAPDLSPGEVIQGRYRLVTGPIGTPGGEAEVYQCHDEHLNETVALKLYRMVRALPKDAVLANLQGLDHPHIVRIREHFLWRKRFCEIQDFCPGGTIETIAPISTPSLRGFLEQIVSGLNYCHSQGIVHRDIKPSNLLFRDTARTELLLADFGISSVMADTEERYHQSSTFARTIDYAAPELFRREGGKIKISSKTDYYALGITLMHLLAGRSPFADCSYEEIVWAHATGDLPQPETADVAFRALLRGLTQHDPENRWGFSQVRAWLDGKPIRDDNGLAWSARRPVGQGRPYPGFPQATNPRELAGHLHEFDAERDLFKRDYIRDWLGHFDTNLAEAAAEIGETYTDRPELGLFKLRYLLDPTLPLELDGLKVHNLEELVRQIVEADVKSRPKLEKLLWGCYLETWIEAVAPVDDSAALSRAVRGVRERMTIKRRQLALFTLLYVLEPQRPLALAPGVTLTDPRNLEVLLAEKPEVARNLRKLIHEGHFEAWLSVQPNAPAETAIDTIRRCREAQDDPKLLAFVARWCANPALALPVGNKQVQSPAQLVTLVEKDSESREIASDLLERGWIRAWLVATGRMPDPTPLDRLLDSRETSTQVKLETLLSLLAPELPAPTPQLRSGNLRFGSVPMDRPTSRVLHLKNTGRGLLHGIITLQTPDPAISLSETRFEGNKLAVTVTVDARNLRVGARGDNQIVIKTNGDTLHANVSYSVGAPFARILGESLQAGLIAGIGLFLFRLFAGLMFQDGQEPWSGVLGQATFIHNRDIFGDHQGRSLSFLAEFAYWILSPLLMLGILVAFVVLAFLGITALLRPYRQ